MSSCHMVDIQCPNCKAEGHFTCWDSVNTKLDPQLKEKVLSGEIFGYTCPNCGEISGVFFSLLYHDMDDYRIIYLSAPEDLDYTVELLQEEGDSFGGSEIDYTKRAVNDLYLFLEKVRILDKGYDDRVIELCKILNEMQVRRNHPEVGFDHIVFDAEKLTYFFVSEQVNIGSVAFSEKIYEDVKKDFAKFLAEDDTLVIDRKWAFNLIQKVF